MTEELIFFATQPFQCGYFSEKTATYAVLDQSTVSPDLHTQTLLLSQGFRRSHDTIYRPYCEGCVDCIPCRIEVEKFKPSKSQRRCFKRNKIWRHEITDPVVTDEIYTLYRDYQNWKHAESPMAEETKQQSPEEALQFLHASWSQTKYILTYDTQDVLIAVTVVDQVHDGLSAVYNFYHSAPEYQRCSLGSYAILNEIQYTQELGLPYLYLGYYLKNTPKMSYKIKYQPLEMYIDKQWVLSEP